MTTHKFKLCDAFPVVKEHVGVEHLNPLYFDAASVPNRVQKPAGSFVWFFSGHSALICSSSVLTN